MKHAVLVLAAVFLPIGASLSAQENGQEQTAEISEVNSVNVELARKILAVSYPDDTHIELFQKTAKEMESQTIESLGGIISDAGALEVVTAWQDSVSLETDEIMLRNIPALMDAWAIAYASTYSQQALEDILAFVSTPSGQEFMAKQVDVISHPAFAQANQAYIGETITVVTRKIPELVEQLQAYNASKKTAIE